jgi:hypothetical protein
MTANTDTAINWTDAKKRVIHSYRDWVRSVRSLNFHVQNRGVGMAVYLEYGEEDGAMAARRSGQQTEP